MNSSIETLFHELADLTDQQRLNYYQQHQIENALLEEVEALITADKNSGTLITPVAQAARQAISDLEIRQAPVRCGPYDIKELLGSGGMGSVYRAERADGEVRIEVAIKLVRSNAGNASTLERFLQERQILATLTHPNIARLLDVGHTDEPTAATRPYLVMELVKGVPIDEWAKGRGVREIVALFLPVCDAVSQAHRQLIIHRDLKPGNILVTPAGVPKLLDFGIAKHLDIASTVTQMLFTPGYASPEQVSGGRLSTATDVYSLGAVLYKLLTGNSPHQFQTTERSGIQAAITESKPQLPSAANPECKGDLDSIVMRALRKEPADRYVSVDRMMEDLHAYLDSRTVAARRGESLYQARKFLRRYWMPVVAVAAVMVSLLTGWILTQQEKRIAERRFADVRGLAGKLLDVETQIRSMPDSLPVRKQIVDSVVQSLSGLISEVSNDTGLRIEVARAYRRVSEVQAQRGKSSFGLHQEAFNSLTNAENLLSTLRRTDPGNREAAVEWFFTESALADRIYDLGKEEESVKRAQQIADELEKYQRSIPVLSEQEEQVAIRVYGATSRALLNAGFTQKAIYYCLLDAKASAVQADRLKTARSRVSAASSFRALGTAQRYAGELEAALTSLQSAEAYLDTAGSDKREQVERHETYFYRGLILGEVRGLSLGQSEQGAHWLQESIQLLRKMTVADSSDVESRLNLAEAALKLGQIQMKLNDPKAALSTFDEGIAILHSAPESNRYVSTYRFRIQLESAIALGKLGKHDAARTLLNATIASWTGAKNWPPKIIGPTSPEDSVYQAKSESAAAAGRWGEALQILEESLRALRANPDFKPTEDLDSANRLSLKLERAGQLEMEVGRGESLHAAERVTLWREWKTKLPANAYVERQLVQAVNQTSIKTNK